jgi:UDP-glucose 6-dehydrogenase
LIFEQAGYNILGVDLFPSYCDLINTKTLKSLEPKVSECLKASKNLRATTNFDEGVAHSDLIFILVDTPTGVAEKSYDHSKLSRVLEQLVGISTICIPIDTTCSRTIEN